MAQSDFPDRDMEDRIRRLELLLSAVIASGSDIDPEILDELYFNVLRRYSDEKRRPDPFMRLLRQFSFQGFEGISLKRRVADLQQSISETQFNSQKSQIDIETLKQRVDESRLNAANLSEELHSFLSLSALGIPQEDVRLRRLLPVRIYISDTDKAKEQKIKDALESFVEAFGFSVADDLPEQRGSWFKKWFVKSKDAITQPEVVERLKKIEKALEIKGLEVPQAEVDRAKAGAVKDLMDSIRDTPQAAVHVGSILIIKVTNANGSTVQIKSLNTNEIIMLESDQSLLMNPALVLQRLSELCKPERRDSQGLVSHIDISGFHEDLG